MVHGGPAQSDGVFAKSLKQSSLLGVRWVPRTRRVVRRRANMKTMNRCYMNTTNRCYPHLHPFKSHTSVSIGHWQTDIVNGATQMPRYDVVKNFEPVSCSQIPRCGLLQEVVCRRPPQRGAADRRRKAKQLERRSRPRTAEPTATGFGEQPPRSPSTLLNGAQRAVVVEL